MTTKLRSIVVEPVAIGAAASAMGNRSSHLSVLFADSPMYSADDPYTDTAALNLMGEKMSGVHTDGGNLSNGFDTIDYDYSDSPDIMTVKLSEQNGAGYPSTPWVPNLTSPGEGNGLDVAFQGSVIVESLPSYLSPVESDGTARQKEQFGSGLQGNQSPDITSDQIGDYVIGVYDPRFGRSYDGSAGAGDREIADGTGP